MIENAKDKGVTRCANPRGPVGEKPPSDARTELCDIAVIITVHCLGNRGLDGVGAAPMIGVDAVKDLPVSC